MLNEKLSVKSGIKRKSELKWNLLFYTVLGPNWGSFIRGDTLKILTWKLNGDLLYASDNGRFPARMPRARVWAWMSCEVRTAPQEPALWKCWAILPYAGSSASSWLFTASSKSNGCLRSLKFLCPPQFLHTKIWPSSPHLPQKVSWNWDRQDLCFCFDHVVNITVNIYGPT